VPSNDDCFQFVAAALIDVAGLTLDVVGSGGRDVTAAMSFLKIQSSEASSVACAAAIGGVIAGAIVQAGRIDAVPADMSVSADTTADTVVCARSVEVRDVFDGSSALPVGADPTLLSDDVWLPDVLSSDSTCASADALFDDFPARSPPAHVGAVFLGDDEDISMSIMGSFSFDFSFDFGELFNANEDLDLLLL